MGSKMLKKPRITPLVKYTKNKSNNLNAGLYIKLDDSIIKLLIQDMTKGNAVIKSEVLNARIKERIGIISNDYDNKINKMLDALILNIDLETYSIENLSKLVKSVMRVTKSLNSSLTSIVIGLEDIK